MFRPTKAEIPKRYSIFILLIFIFLITSCAKTGRIGEEGKAYTIQIQNIKYRILIDKSYIVGPYTNKNKDPQLLFYIIGVYWEVGNLSKNQVNFSGSQLYLIDDKGTTYNPDTSEYSFGNGVLYSRQKCNGHSLFGLPQYINMADIKCGFVGDKNTMLIKLQPREGN